MDRATTSILTDQEIVSVVTDDGNEAEDEEEEEEEEKTTERPTSSVQCHVYLNKLESFLTYMKKRMKQKTALKESDLFKLLQIEVLCSEKHF